MLVKKMSRWNAARPWVGLASAGYLLWIGIKIHRDGGWMGFTILSSVWILVPLYDIYRAITRNRRRTVPPKPQGDESA
ncbi:MAG: hypothetical protein JWO67_4545 [Streptosporangiaceae bacterium]|nr:hypothetical protein [Streptosporangiaceae bacterium]